MESKKMGAALKCARVAAGISVKEISDLLTLLGFKASPNTIYSWENDNSQPTPDALLYMCQKYGIADPLKYFGYKKSPAPAEAEAEEKAGIKEYSSRVIDALVSLGFLTEHKDLTPRQRIVVGAVLQILSVEFGQTEDSTEYWDKAI